MIFLVAPLCYGKRVAFYVVTDPCVFRTQKWVKLKILLCNLFGATLTQNLSKNLTGGPTITQDLLGKPHQDLYKRT